MTDKQLQEIKLKCLEIAGMTNPSDPLAAAKRMYEWITKEG